MDSMTSILLGIIQGLTEFLPVSSSGHLVVFSYLLDGKPLPLELNIAFHLGTLGAVFCYFAKEWLQLIAGTAKDLTSRKFGPQAQMSLGLIVGSIPAGIIGVLFHDTIERELHHPVVVAIPLIFGGILFWWADRKLTGAGSETPSIKGAFIIGCFQMLALFPGVSRSGITTLGGRFMGQSRAHAARYSFFLGTPAMLGAALLKFDEVSRALSEPAFLAGFASSFLAGLLAIGLFLKLFQRTGFFYFMLYRCLLGIGILILA